MIQEEFEDIIADESCPSLAAGEAFYSTGAGTYFQGIPSYDVNQGKVYKEYTKYYGYDDFLKRWLKKDFSGGLTNLQRGKADFAYFPANPLPGGECVGNEEAAKKATAYTGQLVESYQLVQKAIDLVLVGCYAQDDGCKDAIEAIDCAVAAYVGSKEGTEGNNDPAGDDGFGPYALADKRCRDFRTCGPTRDQPVGPPGDHLTAAVNAQIMSLFAAASHAAWLGDAGLLEIYLRLISNKSIIPLIQGAFRLYYRLSDEEHGTGTFDTLDEYVGAGGAYAFGALPKLYACSTRGVKKAEEQTLIGLSNAGVSAVDYQSLRLAFECNYKCLGITCEEVGSLYDGDLSPKPGAAACDDEVNGSVDVCDKPKKSRKSQCKLFTGKPGIKDRNKLKFTI